MPPQNSDDRILTDHLVYIQLAERRALSATRKTAALEFHAATLAQTLAELSDSGFKSASGRLTESIKVVAGWLGETEAATQLTSLADYLKGEASQNAQSPEGRADFRQTTFDLEATLDSLAADAETKGAGEELVEFIRDARDFVSDYSVRLLNPPDSAIRALVSLSNGKEPLEFGQRLQIGTPPIWTNEDGEVTQDVLPSRRFVKAWKAGDEAGAQAVMDEVTAKADEAMDRLADLEAALVLVDDNLHDRHASSPLTDDFALNLPELEHVVDALGALPKFRTSISIATAARTADEEEAAVLPDDLTAELLASREQGGQGLALGLRVALHEINMPLREAAIDHDSVSRLIGIVARARSNGNNPDIDRAIAATGLDPNLFTREAQHAYLTNEGELVPYYVDDEKLNEVSDVLEEGGPEACGCYEDFVSRSREVRERISELQPSIDQAVTYVQRLLADRVVGTAILEELNWDDQEAIVARAAIHHFRPLVEVIEAVHGHNEVPVYDSAAYRELAVRYLQTANAFSDDAYREQCAPDVVDSSANRARDQWLRADNVHAKWEEVARGQLKDMTALTARAAREDPEIERMVPFLASTLSQDSAANGFAADVMASVRQPDSAGHLAAIADDPHDGRQPDSLAVYAAIDRAAQVGDVFSLCWLETERETTEGTDHPDRTHSGAQWKVIDEALDAVDRKLKGRIAIAVGVETGSDLDPESRIDEMLSRTRFGHRVAAAAVAAHPNPKEELPHLTRRLALTMRHGTQATEEATGVWVGVVGFDEKGCREAFEMARSSVDDRKHVYGLMIGGNYAEHVREKFGVDADARGVAGSADASDQFASPVNVDTRGSTSRTGTNRQVAGPETRSPGQRVERLAAPEVTLDDIAGDMKAALTALKKVQQVEADGAPSNSNGLIR